MLTVNPADKYPKVGGEYVPKVYWAWYINGPNPKTWTLMPEAKMPPLGGRREELYQSTPNVKVYRTVTCFWVRKAIEEKNPNLVCIPDGDSPDEENGAMYYWAIAEFWGSMMTQVKWPTAVSDDCRINPKRE